MHKEKYSVIDLFCGSGGLHIGFESAGFEVKLCIDNNSLVERTHRRNFHYIPFINKDIAEISVSEILSYCDNGIDVVIGGPPCQGFSTIGKRASSNMDKRNQADTRNDLVLVYSRIVRSLRPKFIVMENVKGILTMNKGRYLRSVIEELRQAGYGVDYWLINMADYGVPQIRKRVIIIGNSLGLPVVFPPPDHAEHPIDELKSWVNCWTAIHDLESMEDDASFNHVALKHTSKNIERYKLIPEGGRLPEDSLPPDLHRKNFGNTFKRLCRNRPALTMVPGNDAFPIHPTLHRSLTIREAARIQTFSDNIIFEGNRRQQGHQVGNAVPPLFSSKLAKFIAVQMKDAGV